MTNLARKFDEFNGLGRKDCTESRPADTYQSLISRFVLLSAVRWDLDFERMPCSCS